MKTRAYFLHALTPVHAGVGQGLGWLDLPTAREVITNHPFVPGSSLKGVLLSAHHEQESEAGLRAAVFGDTDHQGGVSVSDARLIALPVRSLRGTFAWATSPLVLLRLRRILAEVEELPPPLSLEGERVLVAKGASALLQQESGGEQRVYFEELALSATVDEEGVRAWADWLAQALFADAVERDAFVSRFALLPDDLFDYLAETACDVRSRVKLEEETKTAAKSGPWWEENIPAESVLCGVLSARRARGHEPEALLDQIGELCEAGALQVGGKETVGRGRVRMIVRGAS